MSISCWVSVRELHNQPQIDGIHTLRTLDDSLAIRAALEANPRVAVIGAGFIGLGAALVFCAGAQLGVQEPGKGPGAVALAGVQPA